MQVNAITGAEYTLSNADTLNHVQSTNEYKENKWLTFVQARNAGYTVNKGAKGVRLQRVLEVENKKGEKEKRVRFFYVFNICQVTKAQA